MEDGQCILIIGAGKSDVTAMVAARKVAPAATIIALDIDADWLVEVEKLGFASHTVKADAHLPEQVLK